MEGAGRGGQHQGGGCLREETRNAGGHPSDACTGWLRLSETWVGDSIRRTPLMDGRMVKNLEARQIGLGIVLDHSV